MRKSELIFENPGRKIFLTDEPEKFIYEFNDQETFHDGEQVASFDRKGETNLKIAAAIFRELERKNVQTHFIRENLDTRMETVAIKMFPVRVIVRNAVGPGYTARSELNPGDALPVTLVEFKLSDNVSSTGVTQEGRRYLFTEINEGQIKLIYVRSLEINKKLKPFFEKCGLIAADFALEFGQGTNGEIILAGAISPDNCTLWNKDTSEKIDKTRFMKPLRNSIEDLESIMKRLGSI
ncbi:MAG TPA: phosphoribosylaminoimidazolesuccinocarboxamide synthase [bacterium]|nr:phosphoribosylaminoimidazolesuccinocarboxamide synthase [bacterium]